MLHSIESDFNGIYIFFVQHEEKWVHTHNRKTEKGKEKEEREQQ